MTGPPLDELTAAALAAFRPLVMSITTSTPNYVSTEPLVQQLAAAMPENFFVLNAADVPREAQAKPATKKARAGTRPEGSAGSVADASRCVAQKLRELYVQLATSLEQGRRDAESARLAAIQNLKTQYVEDGLNEADALSAAVAELAEDESDSGEDVDEDMQPPARHSYPFAQSERTPHVVCIVNFPSCLEAIEELSAASVPLNAIVDVQSAAPFGSVRQASAASNVAEKRAGSRGSHVKITTGAEMPPAESVAQLLEAYQAAESHRIAGPSTALSHVLLHTVHIPCEVIQGDAQARHRVTVSEKAFLDVLKESVYDIEAKLHSYRTWTASENQVIVPRYTALPNPDAPPDFSELEAEENAKRKTTSKKPSNSAGTVGDDDPPPAVPQTTPPHPTAMVEVAADRTEFDAYMRSHESQMHSISPVARFAQACLAQASATGASQSLPNKAQIDALRAAEQQEFAARFLDRMWRPRNAVNEATNGDAKFMDTCDAHSEVTVANALRASVRCQPSESNLAAEGTSATSVVDSLSRTLRRLAMAAHNTSVDVDALVKDTLQCGIVPLAGADTHLLLSALSAKHFDGWHVERTALDHGVVLYDLVRGLSSSRIQHGTYTFSGETTFPEYAGLVDSWGRECLFFNPPPPPSDPDDTADDEDDEDEEDSFVEDEEGNMVRRPKRIPTPPPPQDHTKLFHAALRRRRVLAEVTQYINTPRQQSLLALGEGALTASEEVEWVALPDGLLEVERCVCNTRSVSATVTVLAGATFGFRVDDTVAAETTTTEPCASSVGADGAKKVPPHVSSGVRTFLRFGDLFTLQTEVLADNTAAAEAAAYACAVEKATKEAKIQFDAAMAKLKTLKGKEKQSAQVPTLEEIERECLASISTPQRHGKNLPELRVFVRTPQAVLQFNESRAAVRVHCASASVCASALVRPLVLFAPDPENPTLMASVSLRHLETTTVFANGIVDLRFTSAPSLIVTLHPDGSYATGHLCDGRVDSCVTVSSSGQRTIRSAGVVTTLAPVPWSPITDTRGVVVGYVRADQLRVEGDVAGSPARVIFHDAITACRRQNGVYEWHVNNLPLFQCDGARRAVWAQLDGISVCYNTTAAAVMVRTSLSGATLAASLDLVDYRFRLRTTCTGRDEELSTACSSVFEIDAAFGGMACTRVESSSSAAAIVTRVSPLGTCTEEAAGTGRLVVPAAYDAGDDAFPTRHCEPVCPAFVRAIHSTDLHFPRDALHWQCPTLDELDNAAPRLRSAAAMTVPWNSRAIGPARDEAAQDVYAPLLCHALRVSGPLTWHSSSPSVQVCCVALDQSGGQIVFLSEPCRAALLRHWLGRVTPQSLPPVALPADCALAGPTSQMAMALTTDPSQPGAALSWRLITHHLDDASSQLTSSHLHALLSTPACVRDKAVRHCALVLASRAPYCVEDHHAELHAAVNDVNEETAHGSAMKTPTPTRAVTREPRGGPQRLHFWDSEVATRKVWNVAAITKSPIGGRAPSVTSDTHPSHPKRGATKVSTEPPNSTVDDTTPHLYESRAADSYGGDPLLRSRLLPLAASARAQAQATADETGLCGGTASSRGHHPALTVTPCEIQFGTLKAGRMYATLFYVTNTSTVPCRYRIARPPEHAPHLSLHYPHRFLAAGMTDAVEVTLSGHQPLGEMNAIITLAHEGGSVPLTLHCVTADNERDACLAQGVFCHGEAPPPFTPGTTRLRPPTDSDQDAADELGSDEDDASSEDVSIAVN